MRYVLPHLVGVGLLSVVVACNGKSDPSGGDDEGTSGGVPTTADDGNDVVDDGDDGVPTGSGDGDGDGADDGNDSTATMGGTVGETDSAGTDAGMNDPGDPLDCDGHQYQCGDGMDNDGDGMTDLEDPECTGPCDNDEATFQTGIPGDNVDCKQDCFFDGNSGQGDDGCLWDLTCDPANPGANIGCEYSGGNNCNNSPPNQDKDCIEFCTQYVPPGCDCFGCCEVQTAKGPVFIFLNSGPDCTLDNIDGCLMCTFNESCGNPCVPEKCQVCFGETEPPEGCGEVMCPNDLPCSSNAECPTDFYCLLDCCYPPPPG